MKIKHLFLTTALATLMLVSACGSGSDSNNNQQDPNNGIGLDTSQQHGAQPRDTAATGGAGADTTMKTNTGRGNADPSGRPQNQ